MGPARPRTADAADWSQTAGRVACQFQVYSLCELGDCEDAIIDLASRSEILSLCDASKISKRISTSRSEGFFPVAASSRAAIAGRVRSRHASSKTFSTVAMFASKEVRASRSSAACRARCSMLFWERIAAWKPATTCVEIKQCVECTREFFTKSFLGDDAAVLASIER